MRIFKDEPGSKVGFMEKIVGEMINMEAGKEVYRNGIRLRTDKPASYPSFIVDNVRTTISTNYGVIYIPSSLDMSDFVKYLKDAIVTTTEAYQRDSGNHYENRHAALETGSDHFTALKAKHTIRGTSMAKHVYEDVIRRIYITDGSERLEKIIGNRFSWIVCPLEMLVDNVENYTSPRLPFTSQLFSIVYDKDNLLTHANDTLLMDNLTFRDFRTCANIKSVMAWGSIPEDFADINLEEWPEKYRESAKVLQETHKSYNCYPEYIPGFDYNEWELRLCPKRRGRLEIIRQLGNFLPFSKTFHLPVIPLDRDVYELSYHDVNIVNTPAAVDVCRFCLTPLYDDVYAVFPKATSNECRIYCPVCIHARFDEVGMFQADGNPLYNESDIIGRFTYPRTVAEVIDTIKFPGNGDLVKEIIKASFQGDLTIDANPYAIYRALLFGTGTDENVKYIAWNGPVGKYVLYANGPTQMLIRSLGLSTASRVLENAVVFHAFIYNS